jgi:cytochrome bd-type quinol oxidase subunit 2
MPQTKIPLSGDVNVRETTQSFYRVRRLLGYLGFLLPFLLIVGSILPMVEMKPSISDFYHTVLRDLFVGVLITMGVFLVSYQGYERKKGEPFSDNILATVAGIMAFGVALFPNETQDQAEVTLTQTVLGLEYASLAHYICAIIFLFCLGAFCFVRFAQTTDLSRRKTYTRCGWIIVAAAAGAVTFSVVKLSGAQPYKSYVDDWSLVFWAETIAVWSFSYAWLIKGHFDELGLIKPLKLIDRR